MGSAFDEPDVRNAGQSEDRPQVCDLAGLVVGPGLDMTAVDRLPDHERDPSACSEPCYQHIRRETDLSRARIR